VSEVTLPITNQNLFAIGTDSLLQHGCTVFQGGLNACPQNEVSIRQVAEYGEDKGRQRTVLLDSGGNFACLKFASRLYGGLLAPAEEADSFVIILETHNCANHSGTLQLSISW
jgi:hypothetical protein